MRSEANYSIKFAGSKQNEPTHVQTSSDPAVRAGLIENSLTETITKIFQNSAFPMAKEKDSLVIVQFFY